MISPRHCRLVFVAISLAIAACQFVPGTEQHQEHEARDAVSKLLPFPDRARFRGFQSFDLPGGAKSFCGEVNQVAPDGNETGFRPYYITAKETQIAGPTISDEEMNAVVRKCQASKLLGEKTLTEISCGEAKDVLKLRIERNFFDIRWNNNCNPTMVEYLKSVPDQSSNESEYN